MEKRCPLEVCFCFVFFFFLGGIGRITLMEKGGKEKGGKKDGKRGGDGT